MSKNGGSSKVVLIVIFLILFILVKAFYSNSDDTSKKTNSTNKIQESKKDKIVETQKEEKKPLLTDYFSKEMCDSIMNLLENDLLFKGIKFVEKDENLAIYYFNMEGYQVAVTAYEDDGVYNVYIPNSSHTFYDNGEILETYEYMQSHIVTNEDGIIYWIMAQDVVTKTLKNPKSAKYPSSNDVYFQKNENLVAVKGYVDAENSFGATTRSEFVVEFNVIDKSTYSYDLIYFEMEDTVIGKWIDVE